VSEALSVSQGISSAVSGVSRRGRSSKGAYYNENDRQKAQTLRNLIEEGAIAHGYVDERPIQAVQPEDLAGFVQCHFFAGGGVWSHALRLAGWPDDRPVWTGSCPCGPFSVAGKKLGFEDPRHLWPEWFRLVSECRPDRIFGEQSDAADAWIDLVSTDLESRGYAIGSPDIPAAGFGGAHIRQRFYWVADSDNTEWWSERAPWHDGSWPKTGRVQGDGDAGVGGALHSGERLANMSRLGWRQEYSDDGRGPFRGTSQGWTPGSRAGGDADWFRCADDLWRPVEPGTCPLVDATPARMGRLRLYGDAIDAEAAANFIGAYMDAAPGQSAAA
jgi:DNA (cytosine-5)-methyltransferase 1